MCRLIKVVHFGCEEPHTEELLVRCKPAMEYILEMPSKVYCRQMVEVEDWVMSPCRFCAAWEARRATAPANCRGRAMSLQESDFPPEFKASIMPTVGTRDDIAMLGAKRNFEMAFETSKQALC